MNVLKSRERSPKPTLNQVTRFNYAVDLSNRIVRSMAFIRLRLHDLPCSRLSSSKKRYFRQKGKESKTTLSDNSNFIVQSLDRSCIVYGVCSVACLFHDSITCNLPEGSVFPQAVLRLHQLNGTKYLCTVPPDKFRVDGYCETPWNQIHVLLLRSLCISSRVQR